MGGTIKNDGKTLSAILAGTDPSKASRMMTSTQSGVYVYEIKLSVPDGVKANVDYTLTVGANPAVGYDDNGTVSTQYRHTVTVVNPQVKYSTLQLGDINGDNDVNIADVIRLLNHVNGNNPFSDDSHCDVNGDGDVNIADVIRLLNHVNGNNPLY